MKSRLTGAVISIALTLTVHNDGESPVDIDFPSGQRYDFEVFAADGASVWHWADDMFFTMMLGRETLAAGDSLRWTERIEDGLPSGAYRVVGTLTAMEPRTIEASLQVVD